MEWKRGSRGMGQQGNGTEQQSNQVCLHTFSAIKVSIFSAAFMKFASSDNLSEAMNSFTFSS